MTRTTHVFFPEKLYWCVLMTLYKKKLVLMTRIFILCIKNLLYPGKKDFPYSETAILSYAISNTSDDTI